MTTTQPTDYGNDPGFPHTSANAARPLFLSAYDEWRAKAEFKLKVLTAQREQLKKAMCDLSDKIDRLVHAMANGAQGGTAWTLPENKL